MRHRVEHDRRRDWRSALLTLLVLGVLAVTLQSLVFSDASFTAVSHNPSHSVAAGSVDHANDRDGVAIVTATGLRPGASGQGSVTLSGAGDAPAAYWAVAAGITDTPTTPGLSTVLQLRIEDVTGAPQTLYDGALSAFSTVALSTIASDEVRTYSFTLSWPAAADEPALQGSTTSVIVQFVGVSL